VGCYGGHGKVATMVRSQDQELVHCVLCMCASTWPKLSADRKFMCSEEGT